MKPIIFFLIIPILIIGLVPLSYAEIEKGLNYDREYLGLDENGYKIFKWTSKPLRVFDGTQYQDFIYTDLGNALEVKTANSIVRLDKNTCGFSFHNSNDVLLFSDSIIALSSIVNQNTFTPVTQVNNAVCQASWNGSELTATKSAAGIGTIQYKYVLNGEQWKTQLEATNLTSLTDRVFGFDQTIDLNRDVVFFGGSQKNLDNYDGQTFNRTWLENNKGKVTEFLNGVYFDLDIGFEYIDSVTIQDTGANKSKLIFHYTNNNDILLPNNTHIIDPTFGYSAGAFYNADMAGLASASCSTTGDSIFSSATLPVYAEGSGSAGTPSCRVGVWEYDITSIPDSITVSSVNMRYDIDSVTGTPPTCRYVSYTSTQPSTISNSAANAKTLFDTITAGTTYTTFVCTGTTTNTVVSLGTQANTDVADQAAAGDWFAVGLAYDGAWSRTTQKYFTADTATDMELEITYTELPRPDAVDDLTSPSQSFGTVDLLWTEPALNTGNASGYQINYTTPWGNPDTIITNDTGTTTTSATVSGLSLGTDYTFGVSVWTEGGNNATHPPMTWLNVTTQGNFTIGDAAFNQTNSQTLPFTFEEQTINSTAKFLNVTFSNTFDPAYCDFNYKFANINQTYGINDNSYSVSTTLNETAFTFVNATNEIIDVYCWDQASGTDGRYLLTQTDFPLLQQIANFRAGEYGTDGLFGVFDFITLLVVIISMIGLNRVNESVGAVFNIALLGSLAYFEIIELPTVIFGALAIVIVLVVTSTRKV